MDKKCTVALKYFLNSLV